MGIRVHTLTSKLGTFALKCTCNKKPHKTFSLNNYNYIFIFLFINILSLSVSYVTHEPETRASFDTLQSTFPPLGHQRMRIFIYFLPIWELFQDFWEYHQRHDKLRVSAQSLNEGNWTYFSLFLKMFHLSSERLLNF